MARQVIAHKDWLEDGERRFGSNRESWPFVCPACGHVATAREWKSVGADDGAIAFSCVGRWMNNCRDSMDSTKPGPCNYAGGGLFRLNPIGVEMDDGTTIFLFDFADDRPDRIAEPA